MNPRMMKMLSTLLVLLLTFAGSIFAEAKDGKRLAKVTGTDNIMGVPNRTHFNINSISTWIYNNGDSDIKPSGNSGFIFPKGSNKAAVFEAGFVWGATVDGEKRVGGSTYDSGLLPGAIRGGVAEDPDAAHVRIYRVRRDWAEDGASFSAEIADGEGSEASIKAQYELDWNEWPATEGAPFEDINGDGNYDPSVDIPGFVGADQTIWYVANDYDENTCKQLYGSKPMGVELQATFWGYRAAGAVGNIMFRKYKLINTSSSNFDSMYVSMWADPDLGDAGDDFSGCDTTLSLMYTYNGVAHDNVYGDNPPAVGFDFFQGPIIPSAGDTAIVNGKYKVGYKNLPMSAHYFFINGDDVYTDPPLGDYEGTIQFHRLFKGQITTTGAPFTDPNTGEVTKFTLAGDPITGDGWIDGIVHAPGDRRQGMVAGPFNMAAGDTQEVVVAELVGGGIPGVDNLQAISSLKSNDRVAQAIYDNFFNLPSAPAAPIVSVVEQDRKIVLDWGSNLDRVIKTESSVVPGLDNIGVFKFQGYNVYQLPYRNATFEEAKRIATFDIIDGVKVIKDVTVDAQTGEKVILPVQFGTDSGIERSLEITKDAFKNEKLRNGTEYYFFVSAYSFNDSTHIPNNLENPLSTLSAIPQKANPGVEYGGEYGDLVEVTHTSGGSDGSIIITVVDQTKLTGLKYDVAFYVDADTNSATYGETLWKLTDANGKVVLDKQVQIAPGEVNEGITVDGFRIRVSGPPVGIKDWGYDGNRWISGTNWGGGWLFGGMDMGFNFFGSTITDGTAFMDVQLKWAGVTDRSDESATALATKSKTENPDRWSKGTSYARDAGYAATKGADIPFAAYDMESVPPRRLNVCFVEDANNGVNNLLWDMGWDGTKFANNGGREYTFIMASDYNEGVDYDDTNFGPSSDVLYAIWPSSRGSRKYLLAEFTLDVLATNINTPNDVFEFTAPKAGYSDDKAKTDVEKINVFPNPYYGVNPNEINKYQRYVTFNHLPSEATLRIFNLAGQLVKTVNKNDSSQYAKWSLTNENGLPVASGVYIVYVDMPKIGKTKILKVAVIQETQILDRY